MKRVEVPSYPVSIFIAGSAMLAESICADYCDEVGFCVTVTETNYVYTGGEESGVIVGLINYARFPGDPADIEAKALELANRLRVGLKQESFTIQTPTLSIWHSWREADAPNQEPQP